MNLNYYTAPMILQPKKITIVNAETIIDTIVNYKNLNRADVFRKGRQRQFTYARQLIVYFLRKATDLTWNEIGIMFGKDHTTAIHSNEIIEDFKSIKDELVLQDIYNIQTLLFIQ